MWHTKNIKEIEKELRTNIKTGLGDKDVQIRQDEFGKNKIEEGKKESLLVKFLNQFKDFMIIILIIAAIISAVVSYIEGTGDYFDSIIIIAIVVFNGIMGLIQEAKAEKSIEALKKMSAPVAKVKRNGKALTVNGEDIVPGDIVILETGCYVPADIRLINTYNLKVEESSLTGETEAVEKDENALFNNQKVPLGDMKNMVFAGTAVVNGHAEGIVTNIGMNTEVGKIASMIITNEAPQTPIQKKLSEVGKVLGIACVVICALIFVIGVIKKISVVEMFMTSVGLAVAAIPEGLPAIVTIILSIAVTKMAKRNAIIRKLPAVETLGSSKVICSDKTGTLTENNMKVVEIIGNKNKILEYGALCCNCEINEGVVEGEPTEVAIVKEAVKEKQNKVLPRIYEIPFDSNRKLMTTVNELEKGKYRIITKGAPEILLGICDYYEENNTVHDMNSTFLSKIKNKNEKMAEKALRVLGVAYLDVDIMPKEISADFLEKGLIFEGLIGMIDPPRKGVKEAVLACRRAGIKTVMITGDHITTAKAIAKDLEILRGRELAITGQELDKIPDSKLEKDIMNYSVFARVTPEHKVRIVKAFQKTGAVVAMTGDGVNDAPAIQKADIGIGMRITGTEVVKKVADCILVDDSFSTIVDGVEEGRRITSNIKKVILYLLAGNIVEVILVFVSMLLNMEMFTTLQLLWLNLVTDSIPAIMLAFEKSDDDIMENSPANKSNTSFFTPFLTAKIIVSSIFKSIIMIFLFIYYAKTKDASIAGSLMFMYLVLNELLYSLSCRNLKKSVLNKDIFSNKRLTLGLGILLIIQAIMFTSGLSKYFIVTNLLLKDVIIVLGICFISFIIGELAKPLYVKFFKDYTGGENERR